MIFLLLPLSVFIIHSILPTYYHKHFNSNAITDTQQQGILLTFDDGPDEIYTEKLLDFLNKHNIKAIFFGVAKNAKKYPHLIKRMIDEGHEIGLHSLEHKNAWLHSYFYTKKDFQQSLDIMNQLNVTCHLYRPPWGHMNLFTYHFMKKHQLKLCLWNVMIQDWKNQSKSLLKERLIKQCHSNLIICLHDSSHDCGADYGAPLNTIGALELAIPQLKIKGLKFISLERSQ